MFSKTKFLPCMLLIVSAVFSSCVKDDDSIFIEDPNVGLTEYYLNAKLDGQSLLYKVDASGAIKMVNSNDASENPPQCSYSYGCSLGMREPDNAPYIQVNFPDLLVGNCSEMNQVFSGLFHTGMYDLGIRPGGVIISYWDGTQMWTSEPDVQENGFFQVTVSEHMNTSSGTYQKVSGKASCVLTNEMGETKKLEDITFTMAFSPH